jgi:uncharacterized membrane protein YkvI
MEGSYDRPLGVSLIAILLVLSGAGVLITQFLNFGKLNGAASDLGYSSVLFQGAICFLGVIGLSAGIGAWLGKKWGWWLAIFYFAYAIVREINVLVTIPGLFEQLNSAKQGVGIGGTYVKYGVRVLWDAFLLYYLCRENPTLFFQTADVKRWKALLLVFAISIVIFAVGSVIQLTA